MRPYWVVTYRNAEAGTSLSLQSCSARDATARLVWMLRFASGLFWLTSIVSCVVDLAYTARNICLREMIW